MGFFDGGPEVLDRLPLCIMTATVRSAVLVLLRTEIVLMILLLDDLMFVCTGWAHVGSLKAKRAVVRKRMAEVVFNQSRQRREGHVGVQKHPIVLVSHTGGVHE